MIGNLNCDLKDLLVKELENVVMRMKKPLIPLESFSSSAQPME